MVTLNLGHADVDGGCGHPRFCFVLESEGDLDSEAVRYATSPHFSRCAPDLRMCAVARSRQRHIHMYTRIHMHILAHILPNKYT